MTSTLSNWSRPQFGRPKARKWGSDTLTRLYLSPSKATASLRATVPWGTIQSAGTIAEAGCTDNVRMTGGTGAFANAHGTFAMSWVRVEVHRLRLP